MARWDTASRTAEPAEDAERFKELIAGYCVEAIEFVARPKVEETARQWLSRASLDHDCVESGEAAAVALLLALSLAIFEPSWTGTTAIDRLIRRNKAADAEEIAAMQALRQARFRLLRLMSRTPEGGVSAKDLASGEALSIQARGVPASAFGTDAAARLCRLADGTYLCVGPLVPLDPAALGVAIGFVRSGRGLSNPQRCAAAVYRHVARHGAAWIGGGEMLEGEEDGPEAPEAPAECELDLLAKGWAGLPSGIEPPPAGVDRARGLTSFANLMAALSSSALARRRGEGRLAIAYSNLAAIQMETFQRRAAAGTGSDSAPLDVISGAIDRGVAERKLSPDVRGLFDDLRRRLAASSGARAKTGESKTGAGKTGAGKTGEGKTGEGKSAQANGGADDLARVVQLIRALRAKTVEQGCTEQEALASANKVAELLDRYGVSLSEIDIRHQPCEGAGIDTGRRRRGAFDECVPSIAMFCDCKVWSEKTAAGAIRYVFFGLSADVEAAHYLYDLIGVAFDTETARFKSGAVHAEMGPGQRRGSSNSFQIGLGHGIRVKLKTLKDQRDARNRQSSGRDLVPLKVSVIEEEMSKLGLSFHARSQSRRKRVVADAFEAGKDAGQKFEIRAGIEPSAASRP